MIKGVLHMPSFMNEDDELVYLIEERTWGVITGPVGAYYTLISFTKDGVDYEAMIENDDYMPLEEFFLNYGE